jgi:phage/plasmid primase-like uncharacterized protein
VRREAEKYNQRQRDGWARAGNKAALMIGSARADEHGYLQIKGLGDERGLVTEDDALIVPMRHWRTNALVGAQIIRWDEAERRYDKRMLPGMRARGAVFRLGGRAATRTWLVEGYATGLSVHAALRLQQSQDAVLVCFSAGNMTTVARELGGRLVAFADHDESGAGEQAAKAAQVPYVMSPVKGEDANDLHMRAGLFALVRVMRGAQM